MIVHVFHTFDRRGVHLGDHFWAPLSNILLIYAIFGTSTRFSLIFASLRGGIPGGGGQGGGGMCLGISFGRGLGVGIALARYIFIWALDYVQGSTPIAFGKATVRVLANALRAWHAPRSARCCSLPAAISPAKLDMISEGDHHPKGDLFTRPPKGRSPGGLWPKAS